MVELERAAESLCTLRDVGTSAFWRWSARSCPFSVRERGGRCVGPPRDVHLLVARSSITDGGLDVSGIEFG